MHLVEEQDRAAIGHLAMLAGFVDGLSNVLDAGHDRGQTDEMGLGRGGNQPCERRLAAARRAPEHHRVGAPLFDRTPQRLAWPQELRLAEKIVETCGTHAIGEWSVGDSRSLVREEISQFRRPP